LCEEDNETNLPFIGRRFATINVNNWLIKGNALGPLGGLSLCCLPQREDKREDTSFIMTVCQNQMQYQSYFREKNYSGK